MDSPSSIPPEESVNELGRVQEYTQDETPEFLESEPTLIDLWNAQIRIEKELAELKEMLSPMVESFNTVKEMVDNFTDSPMAQMVLGMANNEDQPINMLSE